MPAHAPGSSPAHDGREQAIQDFVDEGVDFPEPLTPVTAVNTPRGIVTSTFWRLFARAPRITHFAAERRPSSAGRIDLSLSAEILPSQRPRAIAQQLDWRALEDHVSAVLPAPGPDRRRSQPYGCFLVMLDDDHCITQVPQARQCRRRRRLSRWWRPIDGSSRT